MLTEPVPLQIRNGVTSLMQELHYGEGYQYAHDREEKLTEMECLPESLRGREYYVPTAQGAEVQVGERLKQVKAFKKSMQEKIQNQVPGRENHREEEDGS